MSHHEEEKNFDYLFYLVALLTGAFVGAIVNRGFIWIPVGAILGLLSAGLFIKVLVRGREEV
ncbi:hypothetical protein [Mucilaginibacter sp.]|uniref:hypothetical protein n=1 Tax=Mucilaginibacter sp. TaxID=1882438 RepID=UPI003262DFA7